jgi:predicted transcriptional regulator of viral defense system
MSKVLLTQSQLDVLEAAIARYRNLVTYEQIAPLIPAGEDQSKRRFVAQLVRSGWLVRIKKGVYEIAGLTTRGTVTLSRYVVASILAPYSYVSFESALQYHGLHDQLLLTTTSVALRQHSQEILDGYIYQYVKTKQEFYFGFEKHTIDGQQAQIATAEKALIDLVQLHRTNYTVDRVTEILASESAGVDLAHLQALLDRSTLTTQRVFGLIFDKLGLTYGNDLVQRSHRSLAASKVTVDSQDYDTKWRLYYDTELFDRYAPA